MPIIKWEILEEWTIYTNGSKAIAIITTVPSVERTNLLAKNRTSTASNASGAMPSGASRNSTV